MIRIHRHLSLLGALAAAGALVACSSVSSSSPATVPSTGDSSTSSATQATAAATTAGQAAASQAAATSPSTTVVPAVAADTSPVAEAGLLAWDTASAVTVELKGTTATASNDAAKVAEATVTLTKAGTYVLKGTLTDGQVMVETADDGVVRVVLNGASITNSTGSPFVVVEADDVVIVLANGTTNQLVDAAVYTGLDSETSEPNAALFSTADLAIGGSGALTVDGRFNDGIASKDDLVILGGTISVTAKDDGLRGKDLLLVKGGTLKVTAGGDGLKADNAEDPALGSVTIAAGTVTIVAGGDGIDAESTARVDGGTITITSGGGSAAQVAADASAKAIKGTAAVVVTNGTISIDSADDALHSNTAVTVSGGKFTIATGDDAIHGDATVTVEAGTITVTKAYEGLESAAISVKGGTISLVTSDDALNAAGGVDGSGAQPGRPADGFRGGGNYTIAISGGTILINSGGDGIDANGSVTMTGGVVLVQGPSTAGNAAVDYDGTFAMSGGVLVAAGSVRMAQAPSTTSIQASVSFTLAAVQPGGTVVRVQDASGAEMVTFIPVKPFQSVVVSTPDLKKGSTYTLVLGGSTTGTNTGGLVEGGTYAAGTTSGSVAAR